MQQRGPWEPWCVVNSELVLTLSLLTDIFLRHCHIFRPSPPLPVCTLLQDNRRDNIQHEFPFTPQQWIA